MALRVITQVFNYVESVRGQVSSQKDRLILLLALAGLSNEDGQCRPSVSTLVQLTSLNYDEVRQYLQELEANGEIHRPHDNDTLIEILVGRVVA